MFTRGQKYLAAAFLLRRRARSTVAFYNTHHTHELMVETSTIIQSKTYNPLVISKR